MHKKSREHHYKHFERASFFKEVALQVLATNVNRKITRLFRLRVCSLIYKCGKLDAKSFSSFTKKRNYIVSLREPIHRIHSRVKLAKPLRFQFESVKFKSNAMACDLGYTCWSRLWRCVCTKRLENTSFSAARAHVTSSLEARGFSREAGRVSLVNPRGTVGLIRSVPRRIPQLCSSSAEQTKTKAHVSKN